MTVGTNGLFGDYPGMFVPAGHHARGRTHCRKCGGRTTDRDKDGRSSHPSCTGNKKARARR